MGSEYSPRPLSTGEIELDSELVDLVERLAEHVHDVWALQRLSEGWLLGAERCDQTKRHPCLIPYSELPESEKAYDRNAVVGTIRAVLTLGFTIQRNDKRVSD